MEIGNLFVKINDSVEFKAQEDETIFQAAYRAGITLNHSCLNGRCNSCIAKVEAGETKILNGEEGLSKKEAENGFILACSRSAVGNVQLKVNNYVEKVLEKTRTFPAKVSAYRIITENLIELELRLPPKYSLTFEPGQYVNLIRGSIKRSYSLASSSEDKNLLFYIKNYSGGKMSEYFFNFMKVNDLIRVEGPIGTFFYRDTDKENIVFLATGTGIAPIKSILDGLANTTENSLLNKNIIVYWGNRFTKEFFWKPEYTNLNIQFRACLSRSSREAGDNEFKYGYIQDLLLDEPIDLANSVVYACGSDQMIKSARILLTKNGLEESSYYSDSFVVSN